MTNLGFVAIVFETAATVASWVGLAITGELLFALAGAFGCVVVGAELMDWSRGR